MQLKITRYARKKKKMHSEKKDVSGLRHVHVHGHLNSDRLYLSLSHVVYARKTYRIVNNSKKDCYKVSSVV